MAARCLTLSRLSTYLPTGLAGRPTYWPAGLTCRPARMAHTLGRSLTGRQVSFGGGRASDREARAGEVAPGRHPGADPGRGPRAVRRARLREDLAARDRRAARRHQERPALP